MSPLVGVRVGVACLGVHGVARAPHTSLTDTHAHRATDDGGSGGLGSLGAPRVARVVVHDGVGGEGNCEE